LAGLLIWLLLGLLFGLLFGLLQRPYQALFAGSTGTPLFCAAFVFTLQGDPALLPVLLLVSAVAAALGERWRGEGWRGEGWNEHQVEALLDPEPSGNSVS